MLLNTTPWPATLPDNLGFPDREVDTVGAPQSLAVENTGGEVLRVSAADVGGDHPDDFLKTGDTCTGASVPPAVSCAIRFRFAPSATGARSATLRLRDNTVQGTHVSVLTGTGTAATGGGGTGPAGPQGPVGPAGGTGAGRCGRCRGVPGRGGRDGCARPRRALTWAAGAARPRRHGAVQAEEVALGQGARDVHGALRVLLGAQASARGWCAGSVVYASTRRAVRRGRVSLRVRPTTRLRHARYRLLLTFTDRKGRATTLAQRVTLR